MILFGRYASPFVRRVAVTLQAYGMAYRHEPLSAFDDFEQIKRYNPLGRVPVLLLDSGEALIESAAILDHLDQTAWPEAALIAVGGEARRATLRICALASGLCDKLVSQIYERRNHPQPDAAWLGRCDGQVRNGLGALEAERAAHDAPFWFGERLTHADIAVTCAISFVRAVDPSAVSKAAFPALAAYAERCEGLPPFKAAAPVVAT